MTTTTAIPTREDFDTQLAEAREASAEAERTLGSATLDNKGAAVTDALEDAQRQERRIEAAIAEQQRREDDSGRDAADAAAKAERLSVYEWAGEYARRLGAIAHMRDQLVEAEDHANALGPHPRVSNLKRGFAKRLVDGEWQTEQLNESDLDMPLLGELPLFAKQPRHDVKPTAQRCHELAARADALAAATKRGDESAVDTGAKIAEGRQAARARRREAADVARQRQQVVEAEQRAQREKAREAQRLDLAASAGVQPTVGQLLRARRAQHDAEVREQADGTAAVLDNLAASDTSGDVRR